MIWLQRFAENNKNSKRKIVAKMDKPGKINLSPMGMRLFGQPPRRLSENSSVLPAPLMDLLLEVLFDLDSDLGAHRSS